MPTTRLIMLESPAELRSAAARWDDLWHRSDAVLPTARANLLLLWLERFAPRARVHVLAVEQGGQWIAGLPLVSRWWLPGWPVAELPGNPWTPAGDLLLDPAADSEAALDVLADGLRQLPAALIHFQAIDTAASRWARWLAALERQGMPYVYRPRIEVSLVQLGSSWPAYENSLSRNHRRQMRRAERDAEKVGGLELRVLDDLLPGEVEPALRGCLEIEHANWKGRAGTSVLSHPQACAFFLDQARILAARRELVLSLLELNGQAIAFEYGWLSKGVYQVLKIGYDEGHASLTPGQLLRWLLFEPLQQRRHCRTVDFLGPRTRATDSWANHAYALSRLIIAPRRLSGRLALRAYRHWRQRRSAGEAPVRQFTDQPSAAPT